MRRLQYPLLYLDFNDRVGAHSYFLCSGSHKSLAGLGLTLEESLGRRFTFWMDDGGPEDPMCEGIIIRTHGGNYNAELDDEDGFFYRKELGASDVGS
jgi:hypothetical protein